MARSTALERVRPKISRTTNPFKSLNALEVAVLHESCEQSKQTSAAKKKEIQQEQDEARQALQGLDTEADPELAVKLLQNSEQCRHKERISSTGYLYFKAWIMPDSSKWYKIGITNDLRRRDAEQNVLPVPATTLQSVRFFSIEHARTAEKVFL